MAARPIWRGHLRLALVSCPVARLPARHERNDLHFNFINPDTGNRVRMVTLDAETGEELSRSHLVRGFECKRDHSVILEDADFDPVRLDSSTTLGIEEFVDEGSIDPIHVDSAYLLVPGGESGRAVYAVLRDAIAGSARIALSRLVLARRERAVAIVAHGRALVLFTLHESGDVTGLGDAFADVPDDRPDASMVKLAQQLVERQAGRFDPEDIEDRSEARLREVIQAKVEGAGIEPDEPEPPPGGNVIDLMDALRRSPGGAGGKPSTRTTPAREPTDARSAPAAGRSKAAPPQPTPSSAKSASKPAPSRSAANRWAANRWAAKQAPAKAPPTRPAAGRSGPKGKPQAKPAAPRAATPPSPPRRKAHA